MQAIIAIVGALLIIGILAGFLFVPLWLLWNWVVPDLFGLPHITLWQSLGLSLLLALLSGFFKSDVKFKAEQKIGTRPKGE